MILFCAINRLLLVSLYYKFDDTNLGNKFDT